MSFSALGSLNANIMASSRIIYAGAVDKMVPFANVLGFVSKDFGTPVFSIIAVSCMATLVVLPGNFDALLNYFGFATWIFFGLCGVSLIKVRMQKSHLLQFKVWPYPAIPVIFILSALAIVISAIIEYPLPSLYATIFILAGVPVYFLFFWRGNSFVLLYKRIFPPTING